MMVLSKRWVLATALWVQTLVVPAFALSEPITLLGVNMAMSRDDIVGVLTENGFSCSGASEMICEADDASVRVAKDYLTFSCEIFDFCDRGIRDIANALVEDRIVSNMQRQFDFIEPSSALVNAVQVQQYCGEGPSGDLICVQMNVETDPFIFIKRGSLGGGGMNFRRRDPLN